MKDDSSRPKVSVIVPAYNCASTVVACLRSLQEQRYSATEILVVDDVSEDGTFEIMAALADSDPRIRLFRTPRQSGAAAARNLALRASSGELLAFLDADMSAPPEWLETLLSPILRNEADVVGGPDYVPPQAPVVSRCIGYAMDNPLLTGGLRSGTTRLVRYLPGTGNLAFRRQVQVQVGFFNEGFHDYGEDKEFLFRVQRAGWRLRYVPQAWAWHHRPPELGAHLRKQFLSGQRRVDIWRLLPGSFEWPHAAPAFGVVAFLSGLFAPWWLVAPWGRFFQALVLGLLILGTVIDGYLAWRKLRSVSAALIAPIASWGIPFGYGAGTLVRWGQVLWQRARSPFAGPE